MYIKVLVFCLYYSLSKITKCQNTLRTSWKKKVEERSKKKSIKHFEQSLKEEKKKKLEVSTNIEIFVVIYKILHPAVELRVGGIKLS